MSAVCGSLKLITYPKDGVELPSCKIADLDDAVGEVVDSRHTWQSFKTALDESEWRVINTMRITYLSSSISNSLPLR